MSAAFDPNQPLGNSFTEAITAHIHEFLDEVATRLKVIDPSLAFTTELAKTFTAGGKRIRPALCYWSFAAASAQPDDPNTLLRAAASLDLLHVSALIHDDVMDGSDSRRGIPAAHRQFESAHRSAGGRGDAAAYGRAAAIQLGDLLLAWSVELAETSGLPPASRARGRRILEAVRTEVISGQLLDIAAQAGLADHTCAIALAQRVVEYKTARYTIQRPAQYGASLGDGTAEFIDAMGSFGLPLGRAFQYRDDILGVFGDEEVTGKPSGDDLREGKQTMLIAEATNSSPHVAKELDSLMGRLLTPTEIDRARHLLIDCGALNRVEERIAADYARALEILDHTPMTDDGRTALRAIAKFCIERTA